MKKTASILLALLVALCGCARTNLAPEQASETQASNPVEKATSAPCPPTPAGYNPFPAGVSPSFTYHLRTDRIYVHANGKSRRRLVLETLDSDAISALASLKQTLSASGFKQREDKTSPDGRITSPWSKKGSGTILLISVNDVGSKPSNPSAKGVVIIDYPFSANDQRP